MLELELTLRPGDFVETEQHSSVMQGLADQIATLGRDVSVVLAEDLLLRANPELASKRHLQSIAINEINCP